jgi:hypothetical protein
LALRNVQTRLAAQHGVDGGALAGAGEAQHQDGDGEGEQTVRIGGLRRLFTTAPVSQFEKAAL